jgi:hypothetical protein
MEIRIKIAQLVSRPEKVCSSEKSALVTKAAKECWGNGESKVAEEQ